LLSRVCPHEFFPLYLPHHKTKRPTRRSRSWRRSQSLSDEEIQRLEALGKREGLTVEQMVRLGINDFIGQPDDAFHAAAKRVMEKNAELYRRLS
jgi:antitoxin FitA